MSLEAQTAEGGIVQVESGWTVLHFEDTSEVSFFRTKGDTQAVPCRLRKDVPFATKVRVPDGPIQAVLKEYGGITLSELLKEDHESGTATYAVTEVQPRERLTPAQLHDLFHDPNNRSIETEYRDTHGGGD